MMMIIIVDSDDYDMIVRGICDDDNDNDCEKDDEYDDNDEEDDDDEYDEYDNELCLISSCFISRITYHILIP